MLYTTEKPDAAGGPLQGCTYTGKPVHAGSLVCIREARQSGRPGDKYIITYMEAGLCRRPCCIHLGSPTLREAHYKDLHTHGSQSMPEAYCVYKGSPTRRETSRNTSPSARPIPTHTPSPTHPHPILTRPTPNLPQILTLPSHQHASPLTPSTQYLPPPADTITIQSHHHHHQGQDSDDYGQTEQSLTSTDKAGIKLLRP